ncbi:hypothetical protein [Umezawaea sp.]|uniref:hypothetical protein n=1 Tax=Umezawaea sp. TaxID=1955258 RepID=UPI002ED5AA1C
MTTTLTRPRVTTGDLLRVAWQRHRALVLVSTVLVVAAAVTIAFAGARTDAVLGSLPGFVLRVLWEPRDVNLLFGAAVAVFWGAPLVAREHEARTALVAWGQDVPPGRWLTGQVALLGAVASCLAAVLWLAEVQLVDKIRELSDDRLYQPFTTWFEVAPQLLVSYALFGFALGAATGTLLRRTLPSMAVALVVFGGARLAVMEWGREHFLPPVRTFEPWSDDHRSQVTDHALYVDSGYADANGVPIDYQDAWGCGDRVGSAGQLDCLKANGVAGHYADFQPVDRLDLFRWIEAGVFLVLAAGLLALAWYWVGRARRV